MAAAIKLQKNFTFDCLWIVMCLFKFSSNFFQLTWYFTEVRFSVQVEISSSCICAQQLPTYLSLKNIFLGSIQNTWVFTKKLPVRKSKMLRCWSCWFLSFFFFFLPLVSLLLNDKHDKNSDWLQIFVLGGVSWIWKGFSGSLPLHTVAQHVHNFV